MVSYIQRHKKRMGLGASSHKEFTINEIERNFLQYLQDSPTAVTIPITDPDEITVTDTTKKVLCSINDLTTNDKSAYDEKRILVPKDANVEVGCYFFFDNCYWIIIFKEHKVLNTYKKFIARRCNQMFRYKVNGVVYDIPVNIENLTMYSDGLADEKYTSQQNAKRMITFGSNPITRDITLNTRIMITNRTVFRMTHLNDFEYGSAYTGAKGIIKALVVQTNLIKEDDLENNIAWNDIAQEVIEPSLLTIIGDEKVMIGSKKTYAVKDISDDYIIKVVNDTGIEDLVNYVTNEDKSVTIIATQNVNYTGCKFKIVLERLSDKEIIDSKTVRITGFL